MIGEDEEAVELVSVIIRHLLAEGEPVFVCRMQQRCPPRARHCENCVESRPGETYEQLMLRAKRGDA